MRARVYASPPLGGGWSEDHWGRRRRRGRIGVVEEEGVKGR